MNSITSKIDELFDEFEKSTLYKNYLECKKQLKNNSEINNLMNDIRRLQKIAVNNKDETVEKELKNLTGKLNTYPLYVSYLNLKEEVEEELFIIKEQFDKYFSEILKINIS